VSREIFIEPLTAEAFAPFGEVIEARGAPTVMINRGICGRYSDLAALDFTDGRAGISVFEGQPYALPLTLEMVEQHPLGSQAFLPMSEYPFLVVVAPDENGVPGAPRAFLTRPGQGVNYRRGVWHGVLTPLGRKALFAVVDRIGDGGNLEEHWFEKAYVIKERE
jgi:ureidoglycolate lyase